MAATPRIGVLGLMPEGHSFWAKLSVASATLAAGLDHAAEAAEYIPDPVPRPAEREDINRWNNVMSAISRHTGVPTPGVSMGQDGVFQGNFRIEGRIDSQQLEEILEDED